MAFERLAIAYVRDRTGFVGVDFLFVDVVHYGALQRFLHVELVNRIEEAGVLP